MCHSASIIDGIDLSYFTVYYSVGGASNDIQTRRILQNTTFLFANYGVSVFIDVANCFKTGIVQRMGHLHSAKSEGSR